MNHGTGILRGSREILKDMILKILQSSAVFRHDLQDE